MKNSIKIHNATFYAYHGVMSEEQKVGRKFEVDAELFFDFSLASQNDKLENTINYVEIYNFIKDLFLNSNFYLIEKISFTIAEKLLKKYSILQKVTIKIRKCHPPVGGLIDSIEAITELEQYE